MTFIRSVKVFMVLMLASVFLFQNCATILRGTSQKIPVTSNPIGAKIIVDGKEMGTTPLNLKLRRKRIHNIRIEKEGYEPFSLIITRKTSMSFPFLVGNLFIGGNAGALLFNAVLPDEDLSFGSGELFETKVILGLLVGWVATMTVDFITGANYKLSPDNLVLSLSKGNEKSQSNLIMIDEEHYQKIKWIRIKFADSEEEEIINLD